jgi:hypothetical protein
MPAANENKSRFISFSKLEMNISNCLFKNAGGKFAIAKYYVGIYFASTLVEQTFHAEIEDVFIRTKSVYADRL